MEGPLDYLFIDEAGQVSLADAVGHGHRRDESRAARRSAAACRRFDRASIPRTSGCSVLEHLLAATPRPWPADRGLFLERTWRMHPDVCAFISELAYDGRLASAAGCERQRIDVTGLYAAGPALCRRSITRATRSSHPRRREVIASEVERLLPAARSPTCRARRAR